MVFAIATIIFLLAAPIMAVVKGYAGLARIHAKWVWLTRKGDAVR
jgi:hypothetical protein